MSRGKKIGLIAGGGELPYEVVNAALAQGDDVFVAALKSFAKPSDFKVPSDAFGFVQLRALIKRFKSEKCTHVTFAGNVSRPDFSSLKPSIRDIPLLTKIAAAATKGDDGLLKFLVSLFEAEGFEILAPQDICGSSLMQVGTLGIAKPTEEQKHDMDKAMCIARLMGSEDIGQGAVVHKGLVLAVEAQEGTDKMLERVAELPAAIGGGVLAKCLKPGQEDRVDMPTIGVTTVELAHKAGMAGIVLVAGQAFVMNQPEVRALANKYGIFIYGIEPDV